MSERTEDSWNELQRAVEKLWPENGPYSKKIKVCFGRIWNNRDHEISIFTTGIDNRYGERGWRWEIFLNRDGTWRID